MAHVSLICVLVQRLKLGLCIRYEACRSGIYTETRRNASCKESLHSLIDVARSMFKVHRSGMAESDEVLLRLSEVLLCNVKY